MLFRNRERKRAHSSYERYRHGNPNRCLGFRVTEHALRTAHGLDIPVLASNPL
jgi:hypothetical protein